jgi:hypothetical protein
MPNRNPHILLPKMARTHAYTSNHPNHPILRIALQIAPLHLKTQATSPSTMALSADAKTMADFLAALTHPDTNAIRQAEAALKPLLKRPECVPVLIEVIKAREVLVRFFVCLSCCYSGQYCWGGFGISYEHSNH